MGCLHFSGVHILSHLDVHINNLIVITENGYFFNNNNDSHLTFRYIDCAENVTKWCEHASLLFSLKVLKHINARHIMTRDVLEWNTRIDWWLISRASINSLPNPHHVFSTCTVHLSVLKTTQPPKCSHWTCFFPCRYAILALAVGGWREVRWYIWPLPCRVTTTGS